MYQFLSKRWEMETKANPSSVLDWLHNFAGSNRSTGILFLSCIPQAVSTMVDASERLQVLLTQEATFYQTSDYLTRMQSEPEQSSEPTPMFSSSSSDTEATSPNKKRKSLLCANEDMDSLDRSPESPKAPKRINSGAVSTTSSEGSSSQINKHWREKICEWAYQGKRGSMDGDS
jgi:hypothetical protein